MNNDEKYMYKTTIKEVYGLTDSWIKRLGDPDKQVSNPHYGSGPPASLYLISRVEYLIDENREEYEKLQERRIKRRKIAQAVADRLRKETVEWAEGIEVHKVGNLPRSRQELEKRTINQYLEFRWAMRGDYIADETLFTMSHNALIAYLRHNHTNYDFLLNKISGRVGIGNAYMIIRNRCDELAEQLLGEVTK
jgi:hypothetical protein